MLKVLDAGDRIIKASSGNAGCKGSTPETLRVNLDNGT